MFVQLLNQNATNILEKNKAIYGFSSFSYTLVFINSFLSSGGSGVLRETGEQRGKGASWKRGQRDKGETRGMKNGKAERGGDPGSELGG